MTTPSTDRLIDLIDRQHESLRQLREMGREQVALVAAGEIDALLVLLQKKQPWLEAVQRIARDLAPFHGEDPDNRLWADPRQREQYQRRLRECDAMYHEIVELEQQSEAELRRQQDRLGERLQETHSAHQAHAAYLSGHEPTGIHAGGQLDVCSEG